MRNPWPTAPVHGNRKALLTSRTNNGRAAPDVKSAICRAHVSNDNHFGDGRVAVLSPLGNNLGYYLRKRLVTDEMRDTTSRHS